MNQQTGNALMILPSCIGTHFVRDPHFQVPTHLVSKFALLFEIFIAIETELFSFRFILDINKVLRT